MISRLQECITVLKNEPYADMDPVLHLRHPVLDALCTAEKTLTIFGGFVSVVRANEKRMLDLPHRGFSCASELARVIRRKTGIVHRTAHYITSTLVRLADEKNVAA